MIKRQPITLKFILAVPSGKHSIFFFGAAVAGWEKTCGFRVSHDSRGCSALIGSLRPASKSEELYLLKEI
jgi:hypothetical protein